MKRATWKHGHPVCWICGRRPATDCHEIARGPHKQRAMKEPAAWFAVCNECHLGVLDSMPIPRQLAYKAIYDMGYYDRVLVNRLRCRADDAVDELEVLAEVVAILRGGNS